MGIAMIQQFSFGMNRDKSRVSVKQAMVQIRMPNAECRKKPQVRNPKPALIGWRVKQPREHPRSPRRHLPTAVRDQCEEVLRILDFGILSDFELRNSDFMTTNLWVSIMRSAGNDQFSLARLISACSKIVPSGFKSSQKPAPAT
jgi:hypothetical protein